MRTRSSRLVPAAVAAAAALLSGAGLPVPSGTAAEAASGGAPAAGQSLEVPAAARIPIVERERPAVSYRTPFVRPLDQDAAVTDGFGLRTAPTAGASTDHAGVDLAAPFGASVRAMAPGTVRETTADTGGCGVSVTIDHVVLGERFSTVSCHLAAGSVVVRPGDRVMQGDEVARVGSTGTSTGPHLHFEVRDATGAATDPAGWLARVPA